jgi:hypothetical protein
MLAIGFTIEVTPFPRRNGMSPEQTQCSVVKDNVPLCFTPNGLIGLLLEPIFLYELYIKQGFTAGF